MSSHLRETDYVIALAQFFHFLNLYLVVANMLKMQKILKSEASNLRTVIQVAYYLVANNFGLQTCKKKKKIKLQVEKIILYVFFKEY